MTGVQTCALPISSAATYFGSDGLLKVADRNLLTYSEQFDNAAWTKDGTVTANSTTAPDGTATADTYSVASVVGSSGAYRTVTSKADYYTFSVYAKANTSNYVFVQIYQSAEYGAYFDLSGGSVGNIVGTGVTASISSAGSGW